MAAQFRIDQVTPGTGTTDRTRLDLVAGEVITLVVPSPAAGATYSWEIVDKVGSAATLSGSTGTTVTIGNAAAIVDFCAFLIKLTETIGTTATSVLRIAAVRSSVTGLRPILFRESADSLSTVAVPNAAASTDNASYSSLAGTGTTAQNYRGWCEALYEYAVAISTARTAAATALTAANAALTAANAHATRHISGAADEIDGDMIDIDRTATNYTPATDGALSTSSAHLTSHLKGIDTKLGTLNTAANTHATRHISGAADEVDADQLDIDYTAVNYTSTTASGVSTTTAHLTSHIKGLDLQLDLNARKLPITDRTSTSWTVAATDMGKKIRQNSASAAITLPSDTAVSGIAVGEFFVLKWVATAAGQPTFTAGAGATLLNSTKNKVSAAGASVTVQKVSANTWEIDGSTST